MKIKNDEVRAFTMVLQFGINMIVPILGCTVFGAWLGDKIGLKWVAIPFFVLGALAGATNVYRLSKRFFKKDSSSKQMEEESNEIIEDTKDVKETE